MHNAKLKTSSRLQKMFTKLKDGRTHTTFQLQAATNDMAPATSISELRHNGFTIFCRYKGKKNGRKIYEYRMENKHIDNL